VTAEHHLAAVVAVQLEVLFKIQMEAMEAKARCEYGPGSSERRRT
jgi:hypothetical protein